MDRVCSTTVNRPVRTRKQGGVGGGALNTPLDPSVPSMFNSLEVKVLYPT